MRLQALIRRYPASTYFVLTYLVSWSGALLVALPYLLRHQKPPKLAGLIMFPVMLIGPCCAGLLLTAITEGRAGIRGLVSRMRRLHIGARWYAALAIPPCIVLFVLLILRTFVSVSFTPNRFFAGAGFGCVAGFFEEIGWTGFAFPRMRQSMAAFPAAALLGVLWGAWHIPVVDYLGAAYPHGTHWGAFFAAFVLAMSAIRIFICWIYSHTQSVLIAQLFHASSTGALVVFSPALITPGQEAFWYFLYAAALWTVLGISAATLGLRFQTKAETKLAWRPLR